MKKICENWSDLYRLVTDGYGIIHQLSNHDHEDCIGWQSGIEELCELLDNAKIEIDPEVYEKILENY